MKLTNKTALITGGTTGIGLAAAKLFQKEGARVLITGRNPATLEAAEKELGPDAIVLSNDAGDVASAGALAEEVRRRFGTLDIAFFNAGIAKFVPAEQVTEDFYDNIFNVNVKGPFFQTQALLPLLREGASVIYTSSVAGQIGFAGSTVYSATKAALRSLVRTFAAELVGKGIRVNAISPGPIATPIFGKLGFDAEQAKATEESMAATNPMKRVGTSAEVAAAALFLASSDSTYTTGSEIMVDGGMTQL